jgi:hypothetical protein
MGRPKKCDLKNNMHPKESISDIFDEMINEEALQNDKNKNIKHKINDSDNDSDNDNDNDNSDEQKKEPNHVKIKEKHNVIIGKLSVIDKFYKRYPHLTKDKPDFTKEVLEEKIMKTDINININIKPKEYVLEKITIKNKTYYRDNNSIIIDSNLKLVGFYQNKGNIYEYIFFN